MLTTAVALSLLQAHHGPTKVIHDKKGKQWETTLTVPVLKSKAASGIIEKWARKEAANFLDVIKDDTGDHTDPYFFEISTGSQFAHGEFVSQSMLTYADAGGAHPNHASRVFNLLSTDTGAEEVPVTRFFRKGVDAYQVLSPILMRELRAKKAEWILEGMIKRFVAPGKDDLEKNTAPLPAPFVTKKGLDFTFDAYAVGSYAEGDYEVVIPLKRIAKSLDAAFVKKSVGAH